MQPLKFLEFNFFLTSVLCYIGTLAALELSLYICFQVQQLIAELNEILAHDVVDEEGVWKKKLQNQSRLLFDFLPQAIQEQLLLERDPHGNVQACKIILVCVTNSHFCVLFCII